MTTVLDQLTGPQAARRQRVIDAAIALAAEGGYEAVQMRDVARRAEVALGTIYRYFRSKDDLLAAAMVGWIADLEARVTRHPPTGDSPADRVIDIIRRATRGMETQPRLAAALISAAASSAPSVVESQREVTATLVRLLSEPLAGVDPDRDEGAARVLAHVWNSANVAWINGSQQVDYVGSELEAAARIVLGDR